MNEQTWQDKLRDALGTAMAQTVSDASERDALEAAMTIADEWQDRLNEIRSESEVK